MKSTCYDFDSREANIISERQKLPKTGGQVVMRRAAAAARRRLLTGLTKNLKLSLI
jgi:hypothetical protein